MRTFLAGLSIALVFAVLSGVVYVFGGITAAEYFSTEHARLDDHMPEELRGEEGQR